MNIFRITEEQYNAALKENITLTADVAAAGGDVNRAVQTAKDNAKKAGVDLKQAKIEMPAVSESILLTKQELDTHKLRKLKESSEVFSVKDFFKKH